MGDTTAEVRLYMVVERFRNGDAVPIYRRLRDSGRMMPEGLKYISSWIDDNLQMCFQVMETHDRALLDEWISHWNDLMEFDVYAVMPSKEVVAKIAPRL